MPVFRGLVLLLLVACASCFAVYAFTGSPRWKALGLRLLRWTSVVLAVFFAVLALERCTTLI